MNYGINLTLFGVISLQVPLMLIGIFIMLFVYFYRTIRDEKMRRQNVKAFNEYLNDVGRLN